MKKIIYLLLFLGFGYANELPLSEEKIELLKLKRQKISQDIDFQKNSWISPLILQASLNNSKDTLGNDSRTSSAGISWSQDVFRSGGILYSIENAEALGRTNLFGIDIEEANYLKQFYTLLSKIKRDTLKLQQS
ncbi:MAG: hypothetical protein A3G74_00560 [Sulfurimonas sp. RIFCSPLOWO2_12_FULL_34_6]|nr:MAG: hypothetical protein A3G74_00560 [Sulfurimonas sp. RIFCSPLOWO2_12_FULL_34_6]